jgi:hypothetical protein
LQSSELGGKTSLSHSSGQGPQGPVGVPEDEFFHVGSWDRPLAVAAPLEHFPFCHKHNSRSSKNDKIHTNFFLTSLKWLCFMSSAHSLSPGTPGAKSREDHGSWSFLLIYFCRNVSISFCLR